MGGRSRPEGAMVTAWARLEASAEALMTIAKNYQTTDARIREAFTQIGQLETPPPNPEPKHLGGV